MSNQEEDFGILKGSIDEPYANFCSTLIRDEFNMVGIYYRKSTVTSIYLFRSFDGTSINYFSHGITLEMLSSHHLVNRLILYPFDTKTWSIAQLNQSDSDKNLFDRFLMAFSRSLMSSNYQQNYSIILDRYFNPNIKEPIPNGYYRINDIILITCGLDTLNRWGSMDRDIIECKYLQAEKELDCTTVIKYHDPPPDKVKVDSTEKLTLLSQEFIKSVVDPWFTQARSTQNASSVQTASSSRSSRSSQSDCKNINYFNLPFDHSKESVLDDKEVLLNLRHTLDEIFNPKLNVCSINLFEIQNIFNLLAEKYSIEPLNFSSEEVNDKSVIFSYPNDITSPVLVPLKCGNTIIISTSGCNLSRFSPDELVEILRYCSSIRNTHPSKRYVNIIIDTIVVELARRNH